MAGERLTGHEELLQMDLLQHSLLCKKHVMSGVNAERALLGKVNRSVNAGREGYILTVEVYEEEKKKLVAVTE